MVPILTEIWFSILSNLLLRNFTYGKYDRPAKPNPERCSMRAYFAVESDSDPHSRQREGDGDHGVVGKSTMGAVNEDRDVHAEDSLAIREIHELC